MLTVSVASAIAIALIWFGYPLVVAGLGRAKGRRAAPSATPTPTVTVVVATVDGPDVARARVENVLQADYPAELLDVVVGIDHRGDPGAYGVLGSGRVRVVPGDAPGGKASTLNAAVRAAQGDVLVFTDAAQRFDRWTIARLVTALGDPSLGAVSGALHFGGGEASRSLVALYWRFEKWVRLQEARLHSAVGVTGAVYAMRRAVWQPLPAGVILDDVFGPMQLVLRGLRIGFEPEATAHDDRHFPPAQELRRKARTLTGVLQLCAWLPAVLVPWRNPIWAQFVFHKVLRLLTPYLLLLCAASGLAWLATLARVQWPRAGTTAFVIMLALLALLVAVIPRVRRMATMALALQLAVVRATVNGLRGHWDVWSR